MMWGYDGWGWWPWLGMGFGMVLLWALIIVGLIALVRYLVGGRERREPDTGGATGSAEQILADRFARGEIDEDEYRQRRELLRQGR
jgi:putative membrane protein